MGENVRWTIANIEAIEVQIKSCTITKSKSTGVYKSTLKLLKLFNPEVLKRVVVVHGANSQSAEKLRSDIGLTSDNSTAYGREDFMKKEINSSWKEYLKNEDDIFEVPQSDYTITSENEIRSKLGINTTTTPPSLIIIDEISKFSAYDLDLIDKFALKYGISVLVAGDFDQSGVVGSHDVNIAGKTIPWLIDLARTDFIRSPKLGVSMRTDNSLKTLNLLKFLAYMQNPDRVLSLNYFEDKTGLYGDKIYHYGLGEDISTTGLIDTVLEDVDKLIKTLKLGEKIGYIYSNKISPIYQALSDDKYKSFIDFKEGGSALGLEALYYIIEANPTVSLKEYLKDIYTGISRALQGSIIISPIEYKKVGFKSVPFNEKISEGIPKDLIISFTKKRKELLDKVVSNGNPIKVIPRILPTIPNNPTETGGLGPAVDPTPPLTIPLDHKLRIENHLTARINDAELSEIANGTAQNFLNSFPENEREYIKERAKYILDNKLGIEHRNQPSEPPIDPFSPPIDPNTGLPIIPPDITEPPIDPHSELPLILPLSYEDDINPFAQPDITTEENYKSLIDKSSEEKNPARSTAEVYNGRISIDMLLHSFNTFETGVLVDDKGMPAPVGSLEWMDARIDSVNGLVKIDRLLHQIDPNHPEIRPVYGKAGYVLLIGDLRSIIFNTKDKAKLCKEIQKVLGLSGIYCTFALKSSTTASKKNRNSGREFVGNKPNPFEKGISEYTNYNGSTDNRSNEWHPKSLVMIIGTKSTGNLLELPLLALSSPITLLKVKSGDGQNMFGEILNRWEFLKKEGLSVHERIVGNTNHEGIISQFSNNPMYKEIIDLFRLYDMTDNAVWYITNNQWTPVNDLLLVGPLVVINKGYYQEEDGFFMNENTNPEDEWLTLELLKGNPLITMTDRVLTSIDQTSEGTKLAHTGHPFVIMSFNKKLNTNKKIIDQYIAQLNDPTVRKEVKLVYVLPPHATIREYLNNLYKILNKEGDVLNIGNLFTSYKLLKQLLNSLDFRNLMETKLPGLLLKVELAIRKIDAIPNVKDLKDALYTPEEWTDLGFPVTKLAGLLDGALMNIAYTRNTLGREIGNEAIFNPDENAINLIELILLNNGIDKVYYRVKVPKDARLIGPFHEPIQGLKYTLANLPFRIHGKIDSYTFRGNISWLIETALSKLVPLEKAPGHYYSIDNLSYLQGNSNLTESLSPEQSIEYRKIKNLSEYIKRKTGINVSVRYGNGRTIQEVNKEIAEEINSADNNMVAFIIRDEIRISSQSPYLKGLIWLYNSNISYGGRTAYPDVNLDHFDLDNNGVYNFRLNTSNMEDNIYGYGASYDSIHNQLTITPLYKAGQEPTINITATPDNITLYLETGRSLLAPLFSYDTDLLILFNSSTYEEFITSLENMDYIGEDRINDLLNLLNNTLNEDLILLINDLIAVEQSHDPEKQSLICPPDIKIKF